MNNKNRPTHARRLACKDNVIRAVIAVLLVLMVAVLVIIELSIVDYNNKITCEEEIPTEQIHDVMPSAAEQPVAQATPKMINEGYTQTLTKTSGVYTYAGRRETYYSSAVLCHKDIGDWWCDCNGFWRTKQGCFVVSSNDYPHGSIIDISIGQACVLDCGCASGVVDIYVNW